MPWDPLHELVSLSGRFTDRSSAAWSPQVDLYETADRYVLVAEMPGLGSGDFAIDAVSNAVTISGRRPAIDVEARQYLRLERGQGEFSRTFSFPEPIGIGEIVADLRDGLLTVTIPKADYSPSSRVDVR